MLDGVSLKRPVDRTHTYTILLQGIADALLFWAGSIRHLTWCRTSIDFAWSQLGPQELLQGLWPETLARDSGCLVAAWESASRLAVVPLAALMGLPASTPATLRESADDSFASPERAVLGVSSPGDGLDPPSTCYQTQRPE